MARDIQLKVMLSPEEWLAVKDAADFEADSQSGWARRTLLKAVREHAYNIATIHEKATDEHGPHRANAE